MTCNHEKIIKELTLEIALLKNKLEQSNNDFLNIVGKNKDGILVFDEKSIIVYANPAALELFGKDLGYLLGENIGIFIDSQTATEITLINKERGLVVAEVNIANISWNNKPAKLASLRDITEHKKLEKILHHLSHFDCLTNLPNRVHFEEELKKSIARANRSKKKMALLYMDVDNFKNINDNYGHLIGDKLLEKVAERLTSCIRINDLASRLSGDEFAIILDGIEKSSDAEQIAKKIISTMKEPIKFNGITLQVTLSIGIAIYPDNGKNHEVLLKNADNAMYCSKKTGHGRSHFFVNK